MFVNSWSSNYFGESFRGVLSSVLSNIGAHPLGTIKTIQMVTGMFAWKQRSSYIGIYNGYYANCTVDAVSFSINNLVNGRRQKGQSRLGYALASGVISSPFVAIGEFMMTNRQVGKQNYYSIWKQACSPGGLHRFNQGVALTVAREVPFTVAVYYCPYYIRDLVERCYPKSEWSANDEMIMEVAPGAISGSLMGAVTTPVDLVKTRVQTSKHPVTVKRVIQDVYQQSRWKGFFRGMIMRSGGIACSVIFIDVIGRKLS